MNKLIAVVLGALFLAGCASSPPAQNIDPGRHPYLARAQKLCADAFYRISAAQQANEFDMGGHAQKAKDLLVQAGDELKQAALTANSNRR